MGRALCLSGRDTIKGVTAMTDGEKLVWAAVYAAYWHSPQMAGRVGHITPAEVAIAATAQADLAVVHLRSVALAPGSLATEVLR